MLVSCSIVEQPVCRHLNVLLSAKTHTRLALNNQHIMSPVSSQLAHLGPKMQLVRAEIFVSLFYLRVLLIHSFFN